jgi:NTE family protein
MPTKVPDVLVLGGGGIVGEAWMSGFLAGAHQGSGVDFREAAMFVGTSAGSIVVAHLAAGIAPGAPRESACAARPAVTTRGTLRAAVGRAGQRSLSRLDPIAGLAITASAPAGALLRAALLASMPTGTHSMADMRDAYAAVLGSRFDQRLRIAAVDRATGQRVVFGAPGAPAATLPDAISASCAVPGFFSPVRIAGREYVDGGVWSATNIDVATVRRGDRVLCLAPMSVMATSRWPAVRGIAGGLQLATALEAASARRRGARVTVVAPDAPAAVAMGQNLMDPRRRERVHAEGFRQGMCWDPR